MQGSRVPGEVEIEALAAALRAGKLALLPTDTLYGISCRFDREAPRERIRLLKGPGRPAQFVALVADPAMAWRYALSPGPAGRALLAPHWPGPLTAVLRARPGAVPACAQGEDGTVALRWPALPWLTTLIAAVGVPIVSTSANRTGEPPATGAEDARALFGAGIDVYLDLGPQSGRPSGLVDLTGAVPRWLRPL